MNKKERAELQKMLDYFKQWEGEGSAEVIAELEASLQQGQQTQGLQAALQARLEYAEKELARNKAEYAGETLLSIYGELLPVILPSLGAQVAGPKS